MVCPPNFQKERSSRHRRRHRHRHRPYRCNCRRISPSPAFHRFLLIRPKSSLKNLSQIRNFPNIHPKNLMKIDELGCEVKAKGDEECAKSVNLSSCSIEDESGKVGSVEPSDLGFELKVEEEESEKVGKLSSSSICIEDEIGKVSLVEASSASVLGFVLKVGGEEQESEKVGNLSDDEIGKVSLVEVSNPSVLDDGKAAAKESQVVSDEDESGSSSESESSSSSSALASSSSSTSSSSEDDTDDEEEEEDDDDDDDEEEEEEEEKEKGEMEEGEIRDIDEVEMVGWSDDDVLADGEDVIKGPIMSKNELKFLPPVPPVDVTLQPCHQTLPVGVVLSIIGTQVIVEGVEKHNPLNEGSILWITESRSPLGLIDEIFGPVKNPYYVVRYNSEKEVPAGINEGTPISFVPQFANHVLNDNNLYKKGYDASGENDEELSDEEFSDDEKEAEYKRMVRMTKRGTNDQGLGNRKKDKRKVKNRDGNWKNCHPSVPRPPAGMGPLPPDQNQHHVLPVTTSLDHGNYSCFPGTGQVFPGRPGLVSPFPQLAQAAGFIPPSNGVWANGMPSQPQQSMVFPNGFPTDSMQWLQQNPNQHPYQMPSPNGMPFQQQFVPSQMLLPNVLGPGGQPNFFAGPSYAPWPGLVGQNSFNQTTFGMGLQGQHAYPSIGVGGQGVLSNVSHAEQSCAVQPPAVSPGNLEHHQQFNLGVSSGRGRQPYRRGGGRFAAGRGRHQTK
ncbi:hypothetical protein L1049_024518 [Liquidambar formosana]|uniref:H/ACA ribonucleoprotein complex non-core subunit NAF1 n=1 Tax=Liquidambar formosana TaxID=63359 RepID=A0AAP0RVD7_LIQFO